MFWAYLFHIFLYDSRNGSYLHSISATFYNHINQWCKGFLFRMVEYGMVASGLTDCASKDRGSDTRTMTRRRLEKECAEEYMEVH